MMFRYSCSQPTAFIPPWPLVNEVWVEARCRRRSQLLVRQSPLNIACALVISLTDHIDVYLIAAKPSL
jgi:hypothetical protein